MMIRRSLFFIVFTFTLTTFSAAQEANPFVHQANLVNMEKFYIEEINLSGFTLNSEQEVNIDVKVISPRRNYRDYLFTYAWILNSDSRQVVWQVKDSKPQERDRYTAVYQAKTTLPAGTYEVYYATYPAYAYADGDDHHRRVGWFFSGFFNALFDDDRETHAYKFFEDIYDDLYCRISGTGVPLSTEQIEEKQKAIAANAFIAFSALKNENIKEQIFKVTEPVEINLYALGEARRDGDFDFGFILNLETRERVWQLSYRNSEKAGGANKNRMVRELLKLEPGIYKAVYVTDDSHAFRSWNEAPPFDPAFWGMMITPVSAAANKALVKLDTDSELSRVPVLTFDKVRDNEYLSGGFTLVKPLNLQIYALGEGRDGDMFDYGWIIDASTRKIVWEMTCRNTESAGGAAKNRMFDGLVRFDPGNYIVYYVTDDSHSFRDWNTSPPYDPEGWGITISVIDKAFCEGDVRPYEPQQDPSILAQLVRIDDHAHKRAAFSLDHDGYVRVYALGEGSHGEMYDYAWIEGKNTGMVVWEMTYRNTERAGGAKKNRQFDDKIYLQAGDYEVCYDSDDSHSFNDWNDRPPRDPFNWGVTITKLDE
jgi:hypothetical protein